MPSTYTLNNGIELIGTGEQSGTWGDTTNTNLELLDTALDGQVTITAASAGSSGSPNSLPITDGSTSDGRNRLVNITSGTDLGSTVFYQLTPNDAEKIIYIRNSLNTQDLIVFQGTYNSSNDYVIPNGTTAVVFFDGAGAGAVAANVFNNAHFDALNVVGQAKITTGSGNTYPTASTSADELIVSNLTASAPSGITIFSDNASSGNIFFGDEDDADNGRIVYDHSTATGNPSMAFSTSATEAMRVDSSQRLLKGYTSSVQINGRTADTQFSGTGTTGGSISIARYNNGAGGPYVTLGHSRGANGTPGTIVAEDDNLGSITFAGDDGVDFNTQGAYLTAAVDGTPGANDMPTRLVFGTTPDGSNSTVERMRINSSGNVIIKGTDTGSTSTNANDTDGNLILNESVVYKAYVATGGTERQFTFDGTSHYYMRATVTTLGNSSSDNGISVGMIVLGRRDIGAHTYHTSDVVNSGTDFTVTSSDSGNTRSWTVKYTNAQSNNNGFMVEVAYYNCRNLDFS